MDETMMNEEMLELVEEVDVPTSGSGLGGKVLGGALIAGAVFAGYKLVKKFWPKKEKVYVQPARISEDEYVVDAQEVEELNKKLK